MLSSVVGQYRDKVRERSVKSSVVGRQRENILSVCEKDHCIAKGVREKRIFVFVNGEHSDIHGSKQVREGRRDRKQIISLKSAEESL